jgi:hypothetical protein
MGPDGGGALIQTHRFTTIKKSGQNHKRQSSQTTPDNHTEIFTLLFLGAFPARSAGNRAFRSNSSAPSGLPVFPLQSLARSRAGVSLCETPKTQNAERFGSPYAFQGGACTFRKMEAWYMKNI